MNVFVAGAVGWGPTELAAFDHSLILTGIANYNLLRLSSVIPPHTEVKEVIKIDQSPGNWGDRMYVVYAEQRASKPEEEAWAGVGWVQFPSNSRGLFVEHEGNSEAQVRSDISKSLNALLKNRNEESLEIHMKVVGGKCIDQPICAFVCATYQVHSWDNSLHAFAE